jgi:hypothetical protein
MVVLGNFVAMVTPLVALGAAIIYALVVVVYASESNVRK